MSIATQIASLEAAGKLTRYTPRGRRPAKRRLYLAELALRDLANQSSATNLLGCRGFVESALALWTLGERVYGDQNGGRFLKPLDPPPPEIWEIRVTEPVVQVRLLGRFAEPDTLILIKFYTRQLLGKKGSANWKSAMAQCDRTWTQLFGTTQPFSGKTIHNYVTENCDDFPI